MVGTEYPCAPNVTLKDATTLHLPYPNSNFNQLITQTRPGERGKEIVEKEEDNIEKGKEKAEVEEKERKNGRDQKEI
jgi:hypothetical protein